MKLNWEALLGPILLLILALVAGTLWMMIPMRSDALPGTAAQAAASVELPPGFKAPANQADDAADPLAQERALLIKSQQTVQKEWDATERSLKSGADEQQRVFLAIQREQERLEDFKNGLGALDRKRADIRSEAERSVEAARLEVALLTKKTELARLETELRNTRSPFEKEVAAAPRAVPATKLPVLVELFRNRAIPVDRKHFHFDIPKWSGPTVATRTDIGETADEIGNEASGFAKFLDGIKTNKQYLACLLNDDSFDIFREVRNMAKAKGIAVGWEPVDSSGGKITIYPVRLVKNAAKAKPGKGKEPPRVTAIIE